MEAAEAEVDNDLCWASIAFPLGLAKQSVRCSSLGSPPSQHGRAAIVPQHHLIFAGTVNAGMMVKNLYVQVR